AGGKPFVLVLLDAMMPEMDGFAVADQIRQHRDLAGVAVLMLSSAGRPNDPAQRKRFGIAGYLTKPVKPSELLDAILTALGERVAEVAPMPSAASVSGRRGLRVLLAEDNAVNQMLAVFLLQKQGHQVTVATTGKKVLAALERQPFDVVLMDVQMPEM